ncbi:peptide chain release factor 1 [Legionella longbeachae]|uniref:peptide chain release factor 1 n=1 Tax=Legionella longbeachae TaxID=450 RepID=UPI0009B7BF3F|nr:peptide chain release factor 1 [Legionella longbeachae]ARB92222.1 peptide chain release factor 1 [Legionella longbeachae]RZV26064.1 peptide chain release factor 1 [Legionella longbeachae]UAK47880.1 peptide chain release factor 1 [Legionella longbeachae]VEE01414.1 peptide chain release factor 1 [Legionella oakridgensis]
MKKSLELKLQQMLERYQEVGRLLSEASVIADQNQFKTLSKEYAQLEPIATCYETYIEAKDNVSSLEELLAGEDKELAAMADEELASAKRQVEELDEQLQWHLIPKDPDDERNIYLEIRAGTGGDEAAIFAGDLYRMYIRYAEEQGWQQELISASHGEHGGYKEIITRISGNAVYSQLKFESGAHRVQRVPETESQGRVHTSACTVAILPEVDEIDDIQINPDDLRIDTYRSSGAGGQHVNKTDSAIRITHIPTGVVVECQDERSQHKNRSKAMSLLKTRLLDAEQSKQRKEQAQTRKSLVGTGDRSERIRTYNYPQSRLTDHRINLTIYQLNDVMEGKLSLVVEPLKREYHAELLAELGRND